MALVAASAAAQQDGLESVPLAAPSSGGSALFERLPAQLTGIEFENRFDWENPRKWLYQHGYAGGGVCIGDYDGDGRPDVYLTSQVGRDRLFRQVGDFVFEDVTDSAHVDRGTAWGTGASFADVDGDGDLDLYACNYDAPNLLYVNRSDGTFVEAAASFGLDFSGASVMAAFADYDRDGDLDLFLLTNRLYPSPDEDVPRTHFEGGVATLDAGMEESFAIQQRVISGEKQKFVIKAGQRDRLYRNDGGRFVDASREAGISGNHPGLSATWWDYDQDGWPDLYVGNDFWDPDYLWHNERDGTFADRAGAMLPHTTWFSMGADFGDVDGDGRQDFLSADMSPTTHFMSKLMMGDMNESRWFLESAQPRQYMRNALYLNTGTERFMEVAFLAGVASTDWTWSVKFGDLDCDGRLDLYFTNGTANHSFDPDLTRELQALEERQARDGVTDPSLCWQQAWELYRKVPPRRERNIALRNEGDLRFSSASRAWGLDHEGISFGAAYSDLDRDGDLDLVVSNVDDPVSVYRNGGVAGQRVLLRLLGAGSNRFGIGATVTVETRAAVQVQQLFTTRGYMSANEPLLHFGLGDESRITRLSVQWPSGLVQELRDLEAGRFYTIREPREREASPSSAAPAAAKQPLFREVSREIGLDTGRATERPFDDYLREPLLPAKLSQLGPGLAWGDADGDGDEDLFVGGPSGIAGQLFVNDGPGKFHRATGGPWEADARCEDMAPLWFDCDADGDLDLYVSSGSNECEPGDPVLRDRLYVNDGQGSFSRAAPSALPDCADSSSSVVAGDLDRDGDLDLFVGGRVIPGQYPLAPASRLLRNDTGKLTDVTEELAPGLGRIGMVTSALWTDADGDGRLDLLVGVEWGPIHYWHNAGGKLEDRTAEAGLASRKGWWNGITGADLDGDGDGDYVVTNAGLNTKYKASAEKPQYLFYGEFEGSKAIIEVKSGADALLPVRGLSCSSQAMPFIKEKLPTYHAFASATLDEIYPRAALDGALRLEANELANGVLINDGAAEGEVSFSWRPLPRIAQAAPGWSVAAVELDGDGRADLICAQNCFSREPETGRWDGGLGLVMRGSEVAALSPLPPLESGFVVPGDARGLAVCDVDSDGRPDVAVTRNDDSPLVFHNDGPAGLALRLRGGKGNPNAVGARVEVASADGKRQVAEVYAGSGYLSQSSAWLYFGRSRDGAYVRVRWPNGKTSEHDVGAEESSVVLAEPPR